VHAFDVLAIFAARESRVVRPDNGEVPAQIRENLRPTAEVAASVKEEQRRTLSFRKDAKADSRNFDIPCDLT
jgi:hypothetical protein